MNGYSFHFYIIVLTLFVVVVVLNNRIQWHICVLVHKAISDSNNVRRQAIIWANDRLLLLGSGNMFQWNFNLKNLYSFNRMSLKMSSAEQWPILLRPQCVYDIVHCSSHNDGHDFTSDSIPRGWKYWRNRAEIIGCFRRVVWCMGEI